VVFASAYHAGNLTARRRRKPWKSRGFEALTGDFLPTRLGEEPHKEGSDEAEAYVEERLRELLEGRVGAVIEEFRRCISRQHLRGNRRQVVRSAIEYLENNREHLKYDEYLAAGYPIGSGVAEGACRHLVKDRLEQTGMRWTVNGAQAMLHVRALYLNDQWEEYLEFRVEQEQARLYQGIAA
jgi:hypothetical protein